MVCGDENMGVVDDGEGLVPVGEEGSGSTGDAIKISSSHLPTSMVSSTSSVEQSLDSNDDGDDDDDEAG